MPLADIKDAGILAGFTRWGWPWHGLVKGGAIGSSGKTITQPPHGSAWLIDMGLPALTLTPTEIASEAALGREWRNYALLPGGTAYGTSLGANKFVHVDEAGTRWLIGMSFSYPDWLDQKIRITFSVVQFGHFGDGVKTPTTRVIDVQCHYITYSMYSHSYDGFETMLEDVWTNGARALVSYGRTRSGAPQIKDLYSVIEVTITGSGGSDGSALVIDAAEIMQDTELSQGIVGADTALTIPTNVGAVSWSASGSDYVLQWSTPGVYWDSIGSMNVDRLDTFTYARYAYYNSAGAAKVARLKKQYKSTTTYLGSTWSTGGSLHQPTPGNWADDAAAYSNTSCLEEHFFGIYLLENNTVVDSLELYDSISITKHYAYRPNFYPPGVTGVTDTFNYSAVPGGWGTIDGVVYTQGIQDFTDNSAQWNGSLASLLGLPAPPEIEVGTGWFFDLLGNPTEPMEVDDLVLSWRVLDNDESAGTVVVAGTASLGVQRIDAKAAAFYKPGATRTYGPALTPLGSLSVGLAPAGNVYFAWQRKTGGAAFDTVPICWV